jgi:RimJ/RimL family protein N-acetyltransferase
MNFLVRKVKIIASLFRTSPFSLMIALRRSLFSFDKLLIFKMDLDRLYPPLAEDPVENGIVKGKMEDLDNIAGSEMATLWEFNCHHHDKVNDFFIYQNGSSIGHISWIYYRGDPNRIIDLQEREAEIKYCYTPPEYRGRSLYPSTLRKIQNYLLKRGFKRVYICVLADNMASIHGIKKAGFELLTRFNLIRIFGTQVGSRRRFS